MFTTTCVFPYHGLPQNYGQGLASKADSDFAVSDRAFIFGANGRRNFRFISPCRL